MNTIKSAIAEHLARLGWKVLPSPHSAVANKWFETAVGSKKALAYLRFSEGKAILTAEYLSEGNNVLSTVSFQIDETASLGDLGSAVESFASAVNDGVAGTYAAKLLRCSDPSPDNNDGADVKDPEVFVTLGGAPNDWSVWRISQNLTDRWGDLNYHNSTAKPLALLEEDKALLERLRSQMWDELTFIVRKDGQYGILFECEFISHESEVSMGDGNEYDQLKPHTEMIKLLDAGICDLAGLFPGVEFAIPDEDHIVNGRPAIWAFVKDGLLDAQDRERLGSFMLQI